MKSLPFAFLPLVALLAMPACGGDSFQDELAFGTGFAGFELTGEASSFTVGTGKTLYFRLESSANFDGRFVRLYFNSLEQKDFAACASDDAHLCLSGFQVSTPGTYEVKAYLVETIVDIGKETLVATKTLTLL